MPWVTIQTKGEDAGGGWAPVSITSKTEKTTSKNNKIKGWRELPLPLPVCVLGAAQMLHIWHEKCWPKQGVGFEK